MLTLDFNSLTNLKEWFNNYELEPDPEFEPLQNLCYNFCKVICSEIKLRAHEFHKFTIKLSHFDPEASHYLATLESFFQNHGFDINQFYSKLGFEAFEIGEEQQFMKAVQCLSKSTQRSTFIFLSAWTAFNMNEHLICIAEAKKISPPQASSLTIMGQAYIEIHRYEEAIESLEKAVLVDKNEPLSWFMLAKAYIAIDDIDRSWYALRRCEKLVGSTDEIALFMAFTSLLKPIKVRLSYSFSKLWQIHIEKNDQLEIVENLLLLSMELNSSEKLSQVIKTTAWNHLSLDSNFLSRISSILKKMGDNQQFKMASTFLTKLIELSDH